MLLTIDTDIGELRILADEKTRVVPLYSKEAFDLISRHWLKVG
jgi:hypothetical protein